MRTLKTKAFKNLASEKNVYDGLGDAIYVFVRFCDTVNAYVWLHMHNNGGLCGALCGNVGLCGAVHGSVRFCGALYDSVGLRSTMYGYVVLWGAMHG